MYQMYITDSEGPVLFPVTPSKISMKINNQNKTITLINEGEVNLIKKPGLTDIAIDELLIPAFQKYPFAVYDNNIQHADYYLNKLERWKNAKTPVQFKLIRTTPSHSVLLWDTNMDVTIESYEIIEDVEKYGFDVAVKLNMKQYVFFGVKKLEIKKNSSKKKKTAAKKKSRKTKTSAKVYIVKSGDCLIRIARKELNNESKWKSIYNLNKKTIEDAARKHGRKSSSNGWWIYPGTKLKLPK